MTYTLLAVLFSLLLLPGVAMMLIPLFPGFWYLLAVTAIFGAVDNFTHLTLQNFFVLVGLFVASLIVDWSAGLLGAKLGGAGWKSLLYGAIGSLAGTLLFPPLGIFAGLFAGVLVGELHRRRKAHAALRAASGALVGTLTGVALNVILAVTFLVLFIVFVVA